MAGIFGKGLMMLYKVIDKHQVLFPNGIKKLIEVNGIKLYVNKLDSGGVYYENQYEETINVLYKLIAQEYKPEVVLDIGANYGFISLICAQYMKDAEFIVVEPNEKLMSYIEKNMTMYKLPFIGYNAMCGNKSLVTTNFYVNYINSQDSRVIGKKGWKNQPIKEISIDWLIIPYKKSVFIKIDAQGYEEKILNGGQVFLNSNNNWIMKMEYAPAWLEWHGTDYLWFLSNLICQYDVAELTILPYNIKTLDDIFRHKLQLSDIDGFLEHIIKSKKNNTGWRDLLIRPKR